MSRDNVIPFRRRTPERQPRLVPSRWAEAFRWFWSGTLDRLTFYLDVLKEKELTMSDLKIEAPASEPVITMTRTLNAPRALVWKALSEPEHVIAWWGPHGHSNRVLEFDFRVGGRWRIETRTSDGEVIVFFGEFLEIEKPVKVTQTFSFDQLPPGMHSVDSVTLEDHGETTVYRAHSTLPDLAARDGMLASGMEVGVREGFERLDAMLEDWKADA
jgi:uncharacterized protein YndB with AHSA1/START domain